MKKCPHCNSPMRVVIKEESEAKYDIMPDGSLRHYDGDSFQTILMECLDEYDTCGKRYELDDFTIIAEERMILTRINGYRQVDDVELNEIELIEAEDK